MEHSFYFKYAKKKFKSKFFLNIQGSDVSVVVGHRANSTFQLQPFNAKLLGIREGMYSNI